MINRRASLSTAKYISEEIDRLTAAKAVLKDVKSKVSGMSFVTKAPYERVIQNAGYFVYIKRDVNTGGYIVAVRKSEEDDPTVILVNKLDNLASGIDTVIKEMNGRITELTVDRIVMETPAYHIQKWVTTTLSGHAFYGGVPRYNENQKEFEARKEAMEMIKEVLLKAFPPIK